jgi:hypothetical protein
MRKLDIDIRPLNVYKYTKCGFLPSDGQPSAATHTFGRTHVPHAPHIPPRQRAAEFLRLALATGPRPVKELQLLAAEREVSWRMVERIRRDLGVRSERVRGQSFGWAWQIPSSDPERARQREERGLVAFLLDVAAGRSVDTRALGPHPSPEAVLELLADVLGTKMLEDWFAELSAQQPNSAAPPTAHEPVALRSTQGVPANGDPHPLG